MLLKKIAKFGIALFIISAAGAGSAQTPPATPSTPTAPPVEKETWKGPFGGTFTASFAFATDYSYRGISQTQRQVAVQAAVGYETPSLLLGQDAALSAYVGAWGSNVNFPGTGTTAEIDLLAGFKLKALDEKLTFDLGYIRYNYLSAPASLYYDFNEFGLVAAYDFGVAQVSAALRYSPNFFANSGNAWYKWGQVAVPLSFININENVSFKLFGTIGNQYVERYAFYGIPYDNYWDWQIGLAVNVYGFDLSIAYVDTNIDIQGCLNTYNCEARAIFTVSKSF
ncbi:TorF family putative porin [Reyranella sp.]|uniref:TorF family putative porin n=1 Tax=Reyranella sp. TaxID=1929291 RepID=UPI003D0C7143